MIDMAEGEQVEGVEAATITQADLARVLTEWESEARAGQWPPRPDMTPEEIGADSAEYLWPKITALSARIPG